MSVSAKQLTLSIDPNHDLTNRIARYAGAARIHRERVTKATEDIRERLYWEQVCEEHDLEEIDRFGIGFDAAVLREERGEYSIPAGYKSPNGNLWWKNYLRVKEKLEQAEAEIARLKAELDAIKERERKEQEEYDMWCDKMERELMELLHGPNIFPQGR